MQIEGNRRNARLSTGQRTERGRRILSMNALLHGLSAQHFTVFDETEEDFRQLMRMLRPKARSKRNSPSAPSPAPSHRIETGLFKKAR